MQNQKKKTFEAFYYWSHVSKTMEKIVGLLIKHPKTSMARRRNKSAGY
jgi:hypothetical protein